MQPVGVAVVGRGLVGSAAARHLAEAGVSVALIGPDEPARRAAAPGPFSSHGDEGRITRIGDADAPWGVLAARSIARYPDIEARSGIRFHHGAGLVAATPRAEAWLAAARHSGAPLTVIEPGRVRSETGIHLDAAALQGVPVLHEPGPAGHINPRRLVAAQTALTRASGGLVVNEAATALRPRPGGGYVVAGPWGELAADRVLVATGAFGGDLVGHRIELQRNPRTVALIELDDAPHAPPLPSLILRPAPDDRIEGFYWVPPVRYPDGRLRLKIGGNLIGAGPLTEAELGPWFRSGGDPVEVEALVACARALLPDRRVVSIDASPCVVTATPTGYPAIGWLDEGLAVALGGNGSAAKSSDELGRLAAAVVGGRSVADEPDEDRAPGPASHAAPHDGWLPDLEAELFDPARSMMAADGPAPGARR